MNPALMTAVAHCVATLGSAEGPIDDDDVVGLLEQLATDLRQLGEHEREEFAAHLRMMADASTGPYREALLQSPEALGLVDGQT